MVAMSSVTIYTKMFCVYCARAKKLLRAKGVAFREIDISFSPSRRTEMLERAGGRKTVPQIFIGETHVGGSDDLLALESSGRLDALLTDAAPTG